MGTLEVGKGGIAGTVLGVIVIGTAEVFRSIIWANGSFRPFNTICSRFVGLVD
jgi:hypothetical protein